METDKKSIDVLYVEDDSTDVDLAKIALKYVEGLELKLDVAEDGEKALNYLRREQPYEKAPRPDLILLDLNLPKLDGREVLRKIKADDRLKTIPVIIFSTSKSQDEIDNSYRLGSNAYIVKPIKFADYKRAFKSICDFWFDSAALCSKKNGESLPPSLT